MSRLGALLSSATGLPPGDRSVPEWVRELAADLGRPDVVRRVSDVFSREVLGSVLVAVATQQVVEGVVGVSRGVVDPSVLGTWSGVWVVTVVLFVAWDFIAEGTTETADTVVEETIVVADRTAEEVESEVDEVGAEVDALDDELEDVTRRIEDFVEVLDVIDGREGDAVQEPDEDVSR